MGNVNIKKRGSVYQYEFEVPKITSKRRRITKSGFKTKREAMEAGLIAQHNFFFTGTKKEESTMIYADYLDYWMENYFENVIAKDTAKRYKESFKTLKKVMGHYKLNEIKPFLLNQIALELSKYSKSKVGLNQFLKVIRSSLRDAEGYFGYIEYDPSSKLKVPNNLYFDVKKIKTYIY